METILRDGFVDGLVVEVECFGKCVDEFDKVTGLFGEMQLKQEDWSYIHASNELHLHVVHVVPSEHEANQHWIEDSDFPDRVYKMSSMGELTFFLGLQVQQKKDGIFISQDKYVAEILKKFRFTEVKTASTPMETQKPLLKDEDGEEVDVHMIGNDWYLKGQPKLGLWYPKDSPFDLVAYTDSDYAGASLDRKSTTGGCQFLRCRLISWQCKKQTVVANSTTEAEYVAASSCCGQETVDKETHMAKPNNYITATRKNFVSNDNEGRMVEKCIVKIQGTFLEKIHNDSFNGNKGENAYEHINKFLDVVGPIKINGLTQDRFRLSIFPVSLTGAAYEWFTKECMGSITTWDSMVEKFILKFHHLSDHNEEETEEDDNPNETNNIPKILRIEGNLFDFETPLCEAYYEFSCLLKIDTDLFTYDIQNFKTYGEYKQEMNNDKAKDTKKPWSENGVPYQIWNYQEWFKWEA
ncbi:putative ribonuclease H-like domain-containing protein [Tanacetum coccineum]